MHTHPMLDVEDKMHADPHPPEAYRKIVSEAGIVRAAALTMAPAADLERTRERNDAVLKLAGTSDRFFFPVCSVHPPDGAAALVYEVLDRYPWWPRQVWIDILATASMLAAGPFAEQFTWVLRKVRADRIMFGSDYPLGDPLQAIAAVKQLGFSSSELQAVMHDNAAKLLEE
jgi:Amidohydrolase